MRLVFLQRHPFYKDYFLIIRFTRIITNFYFFIGMFNERLPYYDSGIVPKFLYLGQHSFAWDVLIYYKLTNYIIIKQCLDVLVWRKNRRDRH